MDIVERLQKYSSDAIAYSDLNVLESKCGRLEAATMMGKLETLLENAASEITRLRAEVEARDKRIAELEGMLVDALPSGYKTIAVLESRLAEAVRVIDPLVRRLQHCEEGIGKTSDNHLIAVLAGELRAARTFKEKTDADA